MVKLSKN